MGYGLRVTASGGEFQIDSDLTTTKHLAVHSKGSFTGNGGKLVIDIGDVVFARGYNSNGVVGVNTNSSPETVNSVSYAKGRVYTFAFPVDWIITKPADNATAYATAIASTNYGLQVKNGSGDVCFDSRILTFGFEIIQIFGKNVLPGLHKDLSGYDHNGNTLFAGASGTFTPGNAAHRKIYVSLAGAFFTPNPLSGLTHMSFRYDQSGNKIKYEGWLSASAPVGINAFRNRSEILVGELTE